MEVKNGFKKTEVGIFPEDWKITTLGELFDFKNGLNKEKKFFGEGTPIVNYMDVYKSNGLLANDIIGKVTVTKQEIRNYSAKKGDVFFTRTSETIEEVGIASTILEEVKDTVFSGFILRARPKSNLLLDYYKKYCFATKEIRKEITSKSSYTTRALTNGRLLSKVRIPLPPLPEQYTIAQVLSDTDNLIQALEKLIAKKRLIKQGVMQKLLTTKIGLEVKKLGDVCKINKGQLITEKTRITGNIPVIAGGKTPAYYHNKANRLGKTITISCSGASAGYVSFHDYPIFASDCSTIEENKNFSIEYIFYLMQLNQNSIYKMQTGGAQPHIHPSDLNPIHFPFPNKKEQISIASILSDMDDEIEVLEKKFIKYKYLKQGLMQNLLTGKIRLVKA